MEYLILTKIEKIPTIDNEEMASAFSSGNMDSGARNAEKGGINDKISETTWNNVLSEIPEECQKEYEEKGETCFTIIEKKFVTIKKGKLCE